MLIIGYILLNSLLYNRYFDYLFFIDFEASMAEPRAQYALEHLQVSLLFNNQVKYTNNYDWKTQVYSFSRSLQDFFVSLVAIQQTQLFERYSHLTRPYT